MYIAPCLYPKEYKISNAQKRVFSGSFLPSCQSAPGAVSQPAPPAGVFATRGGESATRTTRTLPVPSLENTQFEIKVFNLGQASD